MFVDIKFGVSDASISPFRFRLSIQYRCDMLWKVGTKYRDIDIDI